MGSLGASGREFSSACKVRHWTNGILVTPKSKDNNNAELKVKGAGHGIAITYYPGFAADGQRTRLAI
jgi:hypothetical protein